MSVLSTLDKIIPVAACQRIYATHGHRPKVRVQTNLIHLIINGFFKVIIGGFFR